MSIERQELYCHDCGNYVQFDIDMSLNGNHVLTCPSCGHEHCRVVDNGHITDIRWDSRNRQRGVQYYVVGNVSYSSTSSFTTYKSVSTTNWVPTGGSSTNPSSQTLLYQSWMNTVKG